jgi:hypothetical protein
MNDIHNNRIPRLRHFCAPVPCAYRFTHALDSARDLGRRLLANALPLAGPQVATQLKRQRRQKRGRESVQESKQEQEIRQTSFNGLSDEFNKFAYMED